MALLPAPQFIDAVIFDVGGVLLLPDPSAGRAALERLGYFPADEEWRRAHYSTNLVLDAQEGKPDWAAARRAFAAALGVHVDHIDATVPLLERLMVSTPYVPVDGAAETLRLLANAGYKLGIVSNAFGTVADDLSAQRICSTTANGLPQVGIINPSEMSPGNSIEIAIWAAVGGRATLIGPIIGAFIVNGAKSWLTVSAPEYWLYFLGALFIAVTLFLPNGVVGLVKKLRGANNDS